RNGVAGGGEGPAEGVYPQGRGEWCQAAVTPRRSAKRGTCWKRRAREARRSSRGLQRSREDVAAGLDAMQPPLGYARKEGAQVRGGSKIQRQQNPDTQTCICPDTQTCICQHRHS